MDLPLRSMQIRLLHPVQQQRQTVQTMHPICLHLVQILHYPISHFKNLVASVPIHKRQRHNQLEEEAYLQAFDYHKHKVSCLDDIH